jgi:hypothetical protein
VASQQVRKPSLKKTRCFLRSAAARLAVRAAAVRRQEVEFALLAEGALSCFARCSVRCFARFALSCFEHAFSTQLWLAKGTAIKLFGSFTDGETPRCRMQLKQCAGRARHWQRRNIPPCRRVPTDVPACLQQAVCERAEHARVRPRALRGCKRDSRHREGMLCMVFVVACAHMQP